MATPLDFGLIKQFEIIFPFIFMFTILFVIFSKFTPFFKDSKTISGVLAFVVAVMAMFSPIAVQSIQMMAPWFVLMFMFLILTLIGLYTIGFQESDVLGVLGNKDYEFILIIIIIVFVIIGIGSVGKAVADQGGFGTGVNEGQEAEFYQTIFNSKVLGMIFIMMTAFFTIMMLARRPGK